MTLNEHTDIETLISSVNNISDKSILSTKMSDIETSNKLILESIGLSLEICETLLKQLKGYKIIDTIGDLEYGIFTKILKLKYINTIDDVKLKMAGIAVSCLDAYTQEHNRTHVLVKCKLGRRFNNFVFEDCFVFQHIRHDDQLIMNLMDYIDSD